MGGKLRLHENIRSAALPRQPIAKVVTGFGVYINCFVTYTTGAVTVLWGKKFQAVNPKFPRIPKASNWSLPVALTTLLGT